MLPAFNEESRIGPTLEKYLVALESTGLPFEVLVIVDGSDHTSEVAQRLGHRGVQVISEGRKLGKGGAIIAGFRNARFDIVGYVDADGSLSASDLLQMLGEMSRSDTDCLIASRWLPGSRWIRKEPFRKRFASRGFNLLTRGLLRLPFRDTQCGAKLYRGQLIDLLLPQVRVTNLTTDVGFLFHAHRAGAKITELPVTWDDDPRSKFRAITMVPIMLITLLGIRVMNLPLGRFVPKIMVEKFQSLLGSI